MYCTVLNLDGTAYGLFKVCTVQKLTFHLSVSKGRKFKLRHHFEMESLKTV